MTKKNKSYLKRLKKRKKNIFASPYNFRGTLGYFFRRNKGLSKNNPENVKYIPNMITPNKINSMKYRIGFLGDIKDTTRASFTISKKLKLFIDDCDYLIANLEGTLTNKQGLYNSQMYTPEILDILSNFFNPEKFILSVANNHGGDFEEEDFINSINQFQDKGFQIIGTKNQPFYDIGEDFRIVTGTQWQNLESNHVSELNDAIIDKTKTNSFNLLFTHWGYEQELFPRKNIVQNAKKYLKSFNMIVGSHSQCPQPVACENIDGINKIIAYSLGNFNYTRESMDEKTYGIIIKAELGFDQNQNLDIGLLEWKFTKTDCSENGNFKVKIIDNFPYSC